MFTRETISLQIQEILIIQTRPHTVNRTRPHITGIIVKENIYGEYLTVHEKEDEPPSDLQVPYANAGFLLPTSAAFPSPPADPECLTSQNEASPPPPSSSVAPRMTIPLTIECTPRCIPGSREPRGRQTQTKVGVQKVIFFSNFVIN